jgi:hypothetical protein
MIIDYLICSRIVGSLVVLSLLVLDYTTNRLQDYET